MSAQEEGIVLIRRITDRTTAGRGRISLPGKVVDEIESRDVIVRVEDGEIRLIPTTDL